MIDLKPYFDSANKADEEVQRIMGEIDTAFKTGTEEGKQKAQDLGKQLAKAEEDAKKANDLYIQLRDASHASENTASEFVPANNNAVTPESAAGKQMNRDEFTAMDAKARMKFVQDGGKVIDPE